jgi:hypothetical protein
MYKKIIIEIAICLIVLQLAAYFLFSVIYTNIAFPLLFLLLPLFFVINGIVLAKYAEKHAEIPATPSQLLSLKMVKLIGGMFVFIIVVLLNKSLILFFGLNFFVFYLFFLVYETIILLKLNKGSGK